MKTLKGQLANDMLADEAARNELHNLLMGNRFKSAFTEPEAGLIQVRRISGAVIV